MSILDDIQRNSPNIKNRSLILKAFGEELFEKSRTGIYSNTSENRRLKRVGQRYGSKKEGEEQGPERKLREKDKEKEKPQKSLDEHARATSQQALEAAVKGHKDEEVRKAAHKELERRKKEEYPQEEKKYDKKVEDKKEKSPKDKLNERIEDLSDKYKSKLQELMKDENVGKDEIQSKLSKESQEISRYINRCSQFKDVDIKEESKKATDLLGLKDEKEIKDFFGDGNVLGIKVEDNTISVLTDDCYLERTFDKPAVHMDEFILNPDVDKSQGKGTEIFYNQVQSLRKLGFKELNTDAAKSNLYNGYYTWARLGYDFSKTEGKNQLKKSLQLFGDKDLQDIESLPELMATEKGRKFWKENGFSFPGSFRLTDNSESIFILEEYIKDKKNGKEKR